MEEEVEVVHGRAEEDEGGEEVSTRTCGAGWERNLEMGGGVKPCCLALIWAARKVRPRLWRRVATSVSNL